VELVRPSSDSVVDCVRRDEGHRGRDGARHDERDRAHDCAHWQSSRNRYAEGVIWLYGFWTGLNYVAAVQQLTQSEIDSN
jgi:hypothetical protein